ncbi:hypothetical protein CBR_g19468 [Chara braunii]|uniref:Uncharacterized protein n=1 Tax=Chara braunii TaxID=69332 RepID=A0A388KYD3_CHABU|nr:hypothetical protein CBR_g19468 [Chara braunii]|eukprot:GBG74953.1 hypothetical protein CBR_g19468 [Chara braunii]
MVIVPAGPQAPRQGFWKSNQERFNEIYTWWSAENEARDATMREQQREKEEREEREKNERERKDRRKEMVEFHQEMSELLRQQLKDVCAAIVGTKKDGLDKEDDAARLQRENEEFEKNIETRLEKLTLENEELKKKFVANSQVTYPKSGSKRRVAVLEVQPTPTRLYQAVEPASEVHRLRSAYKKVLEDNEAMSEKVRLLKEPKIKAQVEAVELRRKLSGKEMSHPPRSNLRSSFEAATHNEEIPPAVLKGNSVRRQRAIQKIVFEKKERKSLRG